MSTSVNVKYSTLCNARLNWTPCVRIFSPGCAKFTTKQPSAQSMDAVWKFCQLTMGSLNDSLVVLGSLSNSAARTTPMRHSTLHTVSTTKIKVSGYNRSTASSPVQQGRELGYSVPPSPTGSDNVCMETSSLRVCVIIHREEDGYCVRANNLPAYLEANRHVSPLRIYLFIMIHHYIYSS